ncbi:MAG TPA: ABC transporter permease [Vicinamibacterales bacterium]|nr:ABC transporter permease [Vicinamibacterales bacterium]
MTLDRWLRQLRLRIRSIVFPSAIDHELDEELQFHIDQQIAANLEAGMTPDAAKTAALRSFGGLQQRREECRDTRRVSWLLDGMRDLRHGSRQLLRTPLFALVAVLSLGIGIGANVSMFSIVDALLLKKLPIPNPDGLVHFVAVAEPPYRLTQIGFDTYERMRDASPPFETMAAVWPIERANLTVDGPAATATPMTLVVLVTGDYFRMLGVDAAMGRVITRDDEADRPVVVVSDRFWRTRLGSDPNVLSRIVRLNGVTFDVIGVTPAGFTGERVGMPADMWTPFSLAVQVIPEVPQGTRGAAAYLIARLPNDLSAAAATPLVEAIYKRVRRAELAARGIKVDETEVAKWYVELDDASRGLSPERDVFRQSLLILMAGVALLLMVACANVANLLMARSAVRQRELAVRLAVGAGRGRIARQTLTESALLASLGGLAGLAIAAWTISVLTSLLAAGPVSLAGQATGLSLNLRIDPRVLLFATALCAVATMISGIAPALAAQRVAPAVTLRSNRTLGLGQLAGPSSMLVIAQVALSLVLLISAGLFITTLRNLRTQDLGLGRDHELFVWTVPGQIGVRDEAMVELWRRILDRLSRVRGVEAVGAANQAVLNGGTSGTGIPAVMMTVIGEPPKYTAMGAGRVFVTPGFFNAAGIRLSAGREFTERDAGGASYVAILTASMARFYFGSESAAIGRMVIFPGPTNKQPHEIVGVVGDHVRTTPRTPPNYFSTYFPYQHPEAINRGQNSRLRVMLVAVRTVGDPLAIAESVEAEIRAIDPLLPVLRINTTEQQLDDVLAQDRLMATLSSVLSAAAMCLASLGLFGLLSYRVARQTSEIGVRLALGATPAAVLRTVLAESGRLVGIGLVIGIAAALALADLIASHLHGVSANDPQTIAGAVALLAAVAAAATLIPARRAAHVDPVTALREN